jgi:hypothetical protein
MGIQKPNSKLGSDTSWCNALSSSASKRQVIDRHLVSQYFFPAALSVPCFNQTPKPNTIANIKQTSSSHQLYQ